MPKRMRQEPSEPMAELGVAPGASDYEQLNQE